MKLIPIALACLALTGCATSDNYRMYAQAQKAIADAETAKETARYQALAEIAKQGDTAAKVAAVITLNSMGGSAQKPPMQLAAPKSVGDTVLQWTSVLLPSLTQLYSVSANKSIAVTQSNNAAAVAMSTNNTMANIAGSGFTSVTSVANSGLTAATTLGTQGLTTASTISNQGTTALTGIVSNNNATINSMNTTHGNTIQNIMNTIPNLQPNITTTTTTTTP